MRIPALAVLLLVASCGQLDRMSNQLAAERGPSRTASAPAPTIAVAANCSASWDGQAVTPAQITERSVALLERAIAAAGGVQNVTETALPIPNVEAPADLGFACADTILFALQRSGMMSVRLRPAGGGASVLADFPLNTDLPAPPIPMVLGIGAGGQVTWNNEPLDAAGLTAELARHGSTAPTARGDEAPPGGLELRVAREATFGQVHALLRTTSRYHLRPFVYLPSADAGAGQPAAPLPPPPRGG